MNNSIFQLDDIQKELNFTKYHKDLELLTGWYLVQVYDGERYGWGILHFDSHYTNSFDVCIPPLDEDDEVTIKMIALLPDLPF